jgi:hypothetical protein
MNGKDPLDPGLDHLDQARWAKLAEREAFGEALDEHERGFMRRYEANHPELAGERAVFEGAIAALRERLDEYEHECEHEPEPEDLLEREAAAALARYRDEGRRSPRPRVASRRAALAGGSPQVGRGRSRRALVGLTIGLAAAAGVALWFGSSEQDREPLVSSPAHEPARDPVRQPTPAPTPTGEPVGASASLSMISSMLPGHEALALGQRLEVGQASAELLGTNPGARACLSWSDPVAVVCFEGRLRSVVSEHPSERRLRLDDGRLVVALAPLGPGQRFTVETPAGAATAVGTVFAVEVHEGRSWLTVLEGRVELRDPIPRSVYAGHRTSFRGEVPGDEPPPLVADTIPSALTELVAYAELLRAHPGAAALTLPSASELGAADPSLAKRGLANLRVDGFLVAGPVRVALTAGSHTVELFDAHGELIREHRVELDPSAAEPGTELRDVLGQARPKPSTVTASATPRKTAKQLAEAAQAARKQRDYPRTAVLYRELLERYPDSPEAANVPVRLGDLLAANGDPDGALAAYELYLERGAKQLRPEAEYGRIQALRALGRFAEAREASDAFVRARPDDYRSAELRGLLDSE